MRFAFGRNWEHYLAEFTEKTNAEISRSPRFASAMESLRAPLGDLTGKRFLDIGSGSGLFSLAAHELGAQVHSFDFDHDSVYCTKMMKSSFGHPLLPWTIEHGSITDETYVKKLGTFDVVYSWGVLHHTGEMSRAFRNITQLVAPGGLLMIAIYNDQGWRSSYWTIVKRAYVRYPLLRPLVIALHAPLLGARLLARALTGRRALPRGMSYWTDFIDWLGGYPFEVAKPDDVRKFFEDAGFKLRRFTPASSGCNEFVFIHHAV